MTGVEELAAVGAIAGAAGQIAQGVGELSNVGKQSSRVTPPGGNEKGYEPSALRLSQLVGNVGSRSPVTSPPQAAPVPMPPQQQAGGLDPLTLRMLLQQYQGA